MRRTTFRDLGILWGVTLILFYPVFYTHYFYTDDIIQLTHYGRDPAFHMFAIEGRYITEYIVRYLFRSIGTIGEITHLRLFPFLGWMVCIPVWYVILSRVARQEELSGRLPFFTVLYLIACPPFCLGISWISCMELFIANTSGLLAGYALYSNIRYVADSPAGTYKRMELPPWAIAWALLWGIISLFSYQNGFGCFLLPFLLHLISKRVWSRTVTVAIGLYFFTYLVYYGMFRWQMQLWHIDAAARTGLSQDPLKKIGFFFSRPLAAAFRFTWIVREDSHIGEWVYLSILGGWLLLNFVVLRFRSIAFRLRYLIGVFCFLGLIYLPSLIVKENYASNRTLLGLDMAVFILVFTTLFETLRAERYQWSLAMLIGLYFVGNAWYNFHYQFLGPVKKEYDQVRNYIETQYHPGITRVAFIRPPQQLFQDKYGVYVSWDEFGVPSSYPDWVPEDFVRQVILEKTGSKEVANRLIIANWPDKEAYKKGEPPGSSSTLTIDVENILR